MLLIGLTVTVDSSIFMMVKTVLMREVRSEYRIKSVFQYLHFYAHLDFCLLSVNISHVANTPKFCFRCFAT